MKSELVVGLVPDSKTDRTWNFRDDNHQIFFGTIPLNQEVITLTLNWKTEAEAAAKEVGRYKINLPGLVAAGYVRKSDRGYILRFQRSGSQIGISTNKGSPLVYPVGKKP
jgi:hypothetical protein